MGTNQGSNPNVSVGSGIVTVLGSISGIVQANQGTAAIVAWPVYTSQVVSANITGTVSVSGAVAVNQGTASGVGWPMIAAQGAASAVAWPVFTSQAVSVTGFVSVSNTVTVTGLVSVSNTVTVTGLVTISGTVTVGAHAVNQGAASAVAWPMFTSQAVSGVMSISGLAGVNQGAASGVAWPMFTSQVVSCTITGLVTLSGAVGQGTASATAWPMAMVASHTVAQASSVYYNSVLSNVVSNVKSSSGVVYGYTIYNPNAAAVAFVQFYKITAASVGLSTSVAPLFSVPIPSAGVVSKVFNPPVGFATGIAIAATLSNSGSTANATPLAVEVDFQ